MSGFDRSLEELGVPPDVAHKLHDSLAASGFQEPQIQALGDFATALALVINPPANKTEVIHPPVDVDEAAMEIVGSADYLHHLRFNRTNGGYRTAIKWGGTAIEGVTYGNGNHRLDSSKDSAEATFLSGIIWLAGEIKDAFLTDEIPPNSAYLAELVRTEETKLRHFALLARNIAAPSRPHFAYIVSMYDGDMAKLIEQNPQVLVSTLMLIRSGQHWPGRRRGLEIDEELEVKKFKKIVIK